MRILPISLFSFLAVLSLFLFPGSASAATIFEDDFNSYSNGSFPSKWQIYNSTCNPNWVVNNGVLRIAMGGGCGTHLIPNASEWQENLEEYTFEADIRFISGIDRHFSYRLNPNTGVIRVLHFAIPGDFGVDSDNPNFLVNVSKTYHYNVTYRFRMEVSSSRLKVYLIDQNIQTPELIRDVMFNNPLQPGTIGLGSSPGGGGITETWFDNIKVTVPDDFLAVPTLKQTDSLWADDIYDSSLLWQSNNGATIGQVGCALTSAAMVFRYHGLTKMPDGNTDLTPKSLNSYLNSVADANFRNGNTNWQALSKKLSPLLADVNNVSFDKLEFTYRKGQDNTLLDTDLSKGLPVILNVPGHFIVAKGKDVQNNSYHINDPAYDRNSLQNYSNSYINSVTYKPENSDLSYLIFAVDSDVNIHLFDESGQQKGVEVLEEPIDDIEQLSTNLVGPLKVIYFAKPESGNYTLTIDSPSSNTYQLDGYIYDQNDGTKLFTRKGIVGHSNNDTYEISFDKQSVDGSEIINPTVSFETLIADLSDLHLAGNISKKGSYNYISNKIQQAQKYHVSNPQKSESILNDIRQQLIDDKRKGIDVFSNQYLIDQIAQLLNN